MSTTTANLGLIKPATTDAVDIAVLDNNFDKIDGSVQLRGLVVSKAANYSANPWDTVLMDASSGPVTVTLPPPSAGTQVVVKKTDPSANAVTISSPSGTVDGGVSLSVSTQWTAITVVSDGTNYFAI